MRCEKRFEEKFATQIKKGELALYRQCSGWTDIAVARLSHGRRGPIQDPNSAHGSPGTKTYAETVNTQLLIVPPGQTDTWQPLDHEIFGNLKAQAGKGSARGGWRIPCRSSR
jgi:hypothetical protein